MMRPSAVPMMRAASWLIVMLDSRTCRNTLSSCPSAVPSTRPAVAAEALAALPIFCCAPLTSASSRALTSAALSSVQSTTSIMVSRTFGLSMLRMPPSTTDLTTRSPSFTSPCAARPSESMPFNAASLSMRWYSSTVICTWLQTDRKSVV